MPRMKNAMTWLALLLGIIVILAAPVNLGNVGKGDYRAYWSASYLLRQGQNFADPTRLYEIEHELTHLEANYSFMTWNPPWLLVLLEPYTFVSFDQSSWWWLLTNLALAYIGFTLLGHHLATERATRRWIPLLGALLLLSPPTLAGLMSGQVNFLVLFGLAMFVIQWDRGRDGPAGAALALTMIKPHLVYLTLPLIWLESIRLRRWRVGLGFLLVLCGLTAVALIQRPTFVFDYAGTMASGSLLDWQTPTLGGWLDLAMGWRWAKLMGIAVLPIAVILWRFGPQREMSRLVETTLLLSVMTAPFGWSYDQVLILIPVLHAVVDLMEGGLPRALSRLWAVLLIALDVALFYLRTRIQNEVYYFWVPPLLLAIYLAIEWQIARAQAVGVSVRESGYQS